MALRTWIVIVLLIAALGAHTKYTKPNQTLQSEIDDMILHWQRWRETFPHPPPRSPQEYYDQFITLFLFRYIRFVVHLYSFWYLYKPAPGPSNPQYSAMDCTVIIPTVEPDGKDFKECVQTCLLNKPAHVLIVTVGKTRKIICEEVARFFQCLSPETKITILLAPKANKRIQVACAISHVRTSLTVLLDDHVFWPTTFLTSAIAPFEDPNVGAVGTNKRVRKTAFGFTVPSYMNMLGALYLERHNFEIRATNALDGGVFVVSGRTSLHRTCILQNRDFLSGFTNEKVFFGRYGPLNADDDNYITRFEITHGWDIKIQYAPEAMIETTITVPPKQYISKCLRWARTTWRSNSCSLFTDRTVWQRQKWCVYAVHITSFFNFALFTDIALFSYLIKSGNGSAFRIFLLAAWILFTKLVKLVPYFQRHPEDLLMLPGYFAFAYFHSLLKLYALLTFWDCSWSGRDLDAIAAEEEVEAVSTDTVVTKNMTQADQYAHERVCLLRESDCKNYV